MRARTRPCRSRCPARALRGARNATRHSEPLRGPGGIADPTRRVPVRTEHFTSALRMPDMASVCSHVTTRLDQMSHAASRGRKSCNAISWYWMKVRELDMSEHHRGRASFGAQSGRCTDADWLGGPQVRHYRRCGLHLGSARQAHEQFMAAQSEP